MQANKTTMVPELLKNNEQELLKEWIALQIASSKKELNEHSLRQASQEFLTALQKAAQTGLTDVDSPSWSEVKGVLSDISRTRALQGYSPSETAIFVLSLKEPVFNRLRKEIGADAQQLGDEIWSVTKLIDKLALFTVETFQKNREEIIRRQQQEMLELSTPVIRLWDGILAIPLIGTLDSARTQLIMESLLQTIVDTNSKIAILDITGVPTVDTQTAQHLIKTVAAARLMGAECIISGIRPQIAQTIVHLGIEITDVQTKSSMADAVQLALSRVGWEARRVKEVV